MLTEYCCTPDCACGRPQLRTNHLEDIMNAHMQPCACDGCSSKRRSAAAADPTLSDTDTVKFIGDDRWYSVGALRAAASADISVEQRRKWEADLGRRTGAAARIILFDAATGEGSYETVSAAGPVTKRFSVGGDIILSPAHLSPVSAGGPNKGKDIPTGDLRATEAPPLDGYAAPIAALRAASAPAPSFEDGVKADRLRALAAESARLDAHISDYNAAHPTPRMTAAEAADIPAPPDGYALALERMNR